MKKKLHLFSLLFFLMPVLLFAHKKDTLDLAPKPIHKNVIKFNPTPMLLWSSKNVTFSYERILNRRQSISLMVGYLEFPPLFKDTIGNLIAITSRHKQGINVALEYRFYLMKRNSRPAPDGVFLAPYLSYYGYQFKNDVDILHTTLDSAGSVKGNFYVFNLGVELGYQFVFWKRVTLDFVVIGPSMSYYGGSVDINGNINLEKLAEINQDLYDKLKEKYPMIGDFVVNKSFAQKGKLDLFSAGFRYLVQIGFHF
ncbi:MAG: DUF3575 domain-containing protein [Bacteroidetes bacterium]|nr:DUF3575 domain-containing protein [Bacteroidota bacterium]